LLLEKHLVAVNVGRFVRLSGLPQPGQRDGPSKCAIGKVLHILLDLLYYFRSLVEASDMAHRDKEKPES
jgi:hypothetical protein